MLLSSYDFRANNKDKAYATFEFFSRSNSYRLPPVRKIHAFKVEDLYPLPPSSLEDLDIRQIAKEDPRHFISLYPQKVILDEIQQVPELLSYLQTHIDSINESGMYVLTGSQNFLLMQSISQTLAGRTALLTLAPFSVEELRNAEL